MSLISNSRNAKRRHISTPREANPKGRTFAPRPVVMRKVKSIGRSPKLRSSEKRAA